MPDRDPSFAEQPNQEEVSNRSKSRYRSLRYWIGLACMLVGDALVVASLFAPWIEIYKIDPTYPVPRQGYSPWTVLQQGQIDQLAVLCGAYFLVALGLVIATVVLTRARSTNTRAPAGDVAAGLVIVGLALVGVAVTFIPTAVSFSPPYYDHDLLYGGNLAIIGLLSVLVGAIALTRWHRRA